MRIFNICYSLRDVESMKITVFIGCSTQLTTIVSSQDEGLTDGDIGLIAGVVVASVLILVATIYLIKSKLTKR